MTSNMYSCMVCTFAGRQAIATMKELRRQLNSAGSVLNSLLKYKSYNGKLEGGIYNTKKKLCTI